MFGIVFRQELKVLFANRTWWAILGLLVVLAVLATLNGQARFAQMQDAAARLNQDEATTQSALKATVERYEKNPTGDPPSVSSPGNVGLSILGHYAVMAHDALAPMSIGQSDVQPFYYRVTAHPSHTFLNASEIQNPLTQMSGSFDVAFVVIFVLPILIIAVTFDLMSREKEAGVLGLLAAQGVPLRTLILAKIAARASIILLVLLGLVALSAVLIGADLGDAGTAAKVALWFAVIAGYAFFWFALALLINAMNWPSVTNGVVLANLWLFFVVVLPSVANVVASTLYPAPSRVELTTEMREATEEADKKAASAREAYLFDHPELAGAGAVNEDFYIQVLATDAAVERVVAPIMETFAAQAARREGVVDLLQYTSPAIAAQQALNALAGTGNARFENFVDQVLAFHNDWRGFFTNKIIKGERMSAAAFDAIPAFAYTAPEFGLLQAAVDGPLAFMLIVSLALIGWAVRRYATYPIV
jgi:ABC-2 type transport system permease protein